uniref:Uncharacterized protein n=1 Tax=Siphoviridae sp. ctEw721 TaxID=2825400 RepID=A0A8S5TS35_9CAUD|nr:MAG TPA: hypothetical protein [Siphoviridae sp. ctEw721]
MACKFAICKEDYTMIKCRKSSFECPFQRWCTNKRIYESTATKDKCKYYEDGQPQKTE